MKTCTFEGCNNPFVAKGVCHSHYGQIRRGNHLTEILKSRFCGVTGCGEKHRAKGYCEEHYRNLYWRGDPLKGRSDGWGRGVTFHKASGRWRAYVLIKGKQKSLGYHATEEEALTVVEAWKKENN